MSKTTVQAQQDNIQAQSIVKRQSSIVDWLVIVVFLIVFAAFYPALKHGFVDFDDPDNFLRNENYRGLGWQNIQWMFTTFHMGHYQPLTWLTLGLDSVCSQKFFNDPLDPRCYHFTNNFLHALNAALVYLIALRLLTWRRGNAIDSTSITVPWIAMTGALAAALIFGIHPLRAESVAWITERRDLLSAFFLLLSVLAYLRCNRPGNPNWWHWYVVTLVLFAMSLMSKVMGVTLPVVLLILDWHPLGRIELWPWKWFKERSRLAVLEKVPFFIVSLGFSLLASLGQGRHGWLVTLELHGVAERIVQACYGLVFYAYTTVVPSGLLPFYEMIFPLNVREPRFIAAMIVVPIAAFVILMLAARRRACSIVSAALIYAVMLLPVLGLLQNGQQIVADRYSYLPCIGLAIVAGGGLAALLGRSRQTWLRTAAIIVTVGVVGALSVLTWKQSKIWHSTATLWTYAGQNAPNNSRAQNGYGFVLLEQKRYEEALACFQRAYAVLPTNAMVHENLEDLWNALQRTDDGKTLKAVLDFAITIPEPTFYAKAQFQRGVYFMKHVDYASATEAFNEVLRINPKQAFARTNVGWILNKEGKIIQALKQFEQAVQDDPNLLQARYNYGLVLETTGRIPEAIVQYREAALLDPTHLGTRKALERLMNAPR